MGKVKIKKSDVWIDMTPMSDVMTLLLTFFMLTSTCLLYTSDKLVNLLILQHIIIVGRSQFHDKRIVEILAHLQFIIQFIAPDIFRTLGYANDKLPRLLSTTGQQHDDRYIYNKV